MRIKPFLIFALLIFASPAFAQQKKPATKPSPAKDIKKQTQVPVPPAERGTIFFDRTNFDFAEVDEEGGRKHVDFHFSNIGKGDLKILNVVTGCACTSADWDKDRVYKRGDKDRITVSFNPTNLDGKVTRTITVLTDGDPQLTYLTIEGSVYGPTRELQDLFPFVMGDARLTHNVIRMPHAKDSHHDSTRIMIYNTTNKWMKIEGVRLPEYLKYKADPVNFGPKGSCVLDFTFMPEVAKTYGPLEGEITIVTNETGSQIKTVKFIAYVEEDFSKLTEEQKKKSPKIFVKEPVKDLGELYIGETVTHEFEIMNKGKSNLYLRRAFGSCGCTVAKVTAEPIKKGKTGKVSVRFDAKNLYGIQNKNITLLTNDPDHPVTTLTIKASLVPAGYKK